MTGADAASLLTHLAAVAGRRSELTEAEVLALVKFALGLDGEVAAPLSAAERARRYRDRKRHGGRDVDRDERHEKRHGGVTQNVTNRDAERDAAELPLPHTPSPSSYSLSLSADLKSERVSQTRERDEATVTDRHGERDATVTESVTRVALETSCPLDLVERAESAGVITELAHKLKVRPEQVRAAAAEFVSYWTIGEGMGRRRPHWMAKLREHVRRGAHQGRLPEVPPVAELDPETGLPRAQTPRPEVAQRMAAIKARDDARFRELAAKASTHARSPEQVARDREAIARGDVRALLEGIGGA